MSGRRSLVAKLTFGSLLQVGLAGLALIAGYQIAVSAGIAPAFAIVSDRGENIGADLALAYISAWIFNLLVVVAPDVRRRRRVRAWLQNRYNSLKDNLVRHYLALINYSHEPALIIELRDPNAFSAFFSGKYCQGQSRWHAVHNALYEWGIPEIRFYCQSFVSECDMAVGLAGELTADSERLLSRINLVLMRAILAEPDYDEIKALLLMLFSLHCPWSFLDGEVHEDVFVKDIEKL